jgi:hypothetical protein
MGRRDQGGEYQAHDQTSTPGAPASAMVGTSGAIANDIIVPEVYKDEPAFCHALPGPDRTSG